MSPSGKWKHSGSNREMREEREHFMTTTKQLHMLRLEPGLVAMRCRNCDAPVYGILVNGKSVEVDCAVPDGVAPTQSSYGYGVSHVSRCAARRGVIQQHRPRGGPRTVNRKFRSNDQ